MDIEQNTPLDSDINPTATATLNHQLPVAAQYYLRLAAQFALWLFWMILIVDGWKKIARLASFYGWFQSRSAEYGLKSFFILNCDLWGVLFWIVPFFFLYWIARSLRVGIAQNDLRSIEHGIKALDYWLICGMLEAIWSAFLISVQLGVFEWLDIWPFVGATVVTNGLVLYLCARFAGMNGPAPDVFVSTRFKKTGQYAYWMALAVACSVIWSLAVQVYNFVDRDYQRFMPTLLPLIVTLQALWVNLPLVFLFLFAKNITLGGATQGSAHLTKGLRYLVFWLLATVLLHGQGALSSLLQLGIKNNPFMSYLVYILIVLATCVAFYFWQRRLVRQEPG